MKTAIYIEDGVTQLVITPESEFEKKALLAFENKELSTKIFTGTFYDCRGGWTRQSEVYNRLSYDSTKDDNSLIVRIEDERKVGGK